VGYLDEGLTVAGAQTARPHQADRQAVAANMFVDGLIDSLRPSRQTACRQSNADNAVHGFLTILY
jgi:hypothetical protein